MWGRGGGGEEKEQHGLKLSTSFGMMSKTQYYRLRENIVLRKQLGLKTMSAFGLHLVSVLYTTKKKNSPSNQGY